MGWDVGTSGWWAAAGVVGALVALAVLRPWRFWLARRPCPQCRRILPRWNAWGWKDDWTCSGCGCRINC